MPRLGVVADDLTGATTVGALLARSGIDNVVVMDQSRIDADDMIHEAIVLSSDSRPLPPTDAREKVKTATVKLIESGATFFTKRIDTTCRGGIGYEVGAMLEALSENGDDRIAVIVPAMPQSRRIVIGGYSLIDSVLLAETGVAHDVRTPVRESHLPTLIGSQLGGKLVHVGIESLILGPGHLRMSMEEARAAGAQAILVDAGSVAHVAMIAGVIADLAWDVVAVDPGVFTQQLMIAHGIGESDELVADDDGNAYVEEETVLVVAGSAAEVTHRQMVRLAQEPGSAVLSVSIAPLVRGGEELTKEQDRLRCQLDELLSGESAPPIVIVGLESTLSGRRADVSALERECGLALGCGASLISRRFGALGAYAARRIGSRLAGLFLTGGDVMVETCAALDVAGLDMIGYVIPQVDQARLVGGPFHGLPVVCKGGLTGSPDTGVRCVHRIFREKAKV